MRAGMVIALFNTFFAGASKQLAMVIEGEALLNDGAAIVFFNVFLKLTTTEVGLSGLYIFFCISNKFLIRQ